MEDKNLITLEPKTRKIFTKIIFIALFFVIASSCAYFFSARARNFTENGVAAVFSSWKSVFGGSSSEYILSDGDFLTDNASDSVIADAASSSFDENILADAGSDVAGVDNNGKTVAKKTSSKKILAPKEPSAPGIPAASTALKNSSNDPAPQNFSPSSTPSISTVSISSNTENISPPLSSPPPQCTVSADANISRKIILNEIAWMGSVPLAGESASAAGNREWIELKNISGDPLALANWQLTNFSGSVKIIFSATDTIPAAGFYLLARGDNDIASVTADKIYSGALANSGDTLILFDPTCAASDILNASAGWPAGNNTTKQTLERDSNGIGWHTSVSPGGTPKAENSVVASVAAAMDGSSVIIDPAPPLASIPPPVSSSPTPAPSSSASSSLPQSQTNISSTDPVAATSTLASSTPASTAVTHLVIAAVEIAGASSTNDFVKIYNPATLAIDISGWKLRKKSSTGTDSSLREFPAESVILPGGYFLWANAANGFGDAMHANVTSTETLAADNSVALLNTSGTIVDAVGWGTGTDQYLEGNIYATNPTANQVLQRTFLQNGAVIDTDNNANDFTIQ